MSLMQKAPEARGSGDYIVGEDPNHRCQPGVPVEPHPEHCEWYYTCYANEPTYIWHCYSNYLFDLRYFGCNFPEQTDCGNRPKPNTTSKCYT